jgi:hypothetical protein
MITFEKPNYSFGKVEFNVDNILSENILEPFPNKSFFMVACGKAGSGKTSLIINTLAAKGANRVYRKVFNKIILIMPKNSRKSLKNDLFNDLPESQKFEYFDENVIKKINEIKEEFDEENEKLKKAKKPTKQFNQLLVMDDITAYLKDKNVVHDLVELATNRRHFQLSMMLMVQFLRSIPKSVRLQVTDVIFFKPSNNLDTQILQDEYSSLSKDEFDEMKRHIWEDEHDFLFINKNKDLYYKNLQRINFNNLEDKPIEAIIEPIKPIKQKSKLRTFNSNSWDYINNH